jgi:hypothetical protein
VDRPVVAKGEAEVDEPSEAHLEEEVAGRRRAARRVRRPEQDATAAEASTNRAHSAERAALRDERRREELPMRVEERSASREVAR